MMVLAVVGGFLVVSLLGSRLDLDRFTRDVVIDGDRTPSVPGTLPFSVDAPLDGSSADTMAVGIAVEDRGIGTPECTLSTSSGDPVALSRTSFDPHPDQRTRLVDRRGQRTPRTRGLPGRLPLAG